jgi:hypothetical protein
LGRFATLTHARVRLVQNEEQQNKLRELRIPVERSRLFLYAEVRMITI